MIEIDWTPETLAKLEKCSALSSQMRDLIGIDATYAWHQKLSVTWYKDLDGTIKLIQTELDRIKSQP